MNKKLKDLIVKTIEQEFAIEPAERAAIRLREAGVTGNDLWELGNKYLPDPQRISVANKLRDMEIAENE